MDNVLATYFIICLLLICAIGCSAWGIAKKNKLYPSVISFQLDELKFPGLFVTLLSRIVFGFKLWHYFFFLLWNKKNHKELKKNLEDKIIGLEIEKLYFSIARNRDIGLLFYLILEIGLLGALSCHKYSPYFIPQCIIEISVAYASFRVLAIFFGFFGDIIFREKKYRSVLWKHVNGDRQVISNSRNLLIALVGLCQVYICFSILWAAEYAKNNSYCLYATKTFFGWMIESVKHSTLSNSSDNAILNLIQFFITSSYLLLFVSFYLSEINSKEIESKTD